MYYHKDWLMRQIEMSIHGIARIIFRKDSLEYALHDEQRSEADREADLLFIKLCALITENKINEAENLLFSMLDSTNRDFLLLAVDFYQRLNALTDEQLAAAAFPREEIEAGLNEVKRIYGLPV